MNWESASGLCCAASPLEPPFIAIDELTETLFGSNLSLLGRSRRKPYQGCLLSQTVLRTDWASPFFASSYTLAWTGRLECEGFLHSLLRYRKLFYMFAISPQALSFVSPFSHSSYIFIIPSSFTTISFHTLGYLPRPSLPLVTTPPCYQWPWSLFLFDFDYPSDFPILRPIFKPVYGLPRLYFPAPFQPLCCRCSLTDRKSVV